MNYNQDFCLLKNFSINFTSLYFCIFHYQDSLNSFTGTDYFKFGFDEFVFAYSFSTMMSDFLHTRFRFELTLSFLYFYNQFVTKSNDWALITNHFQ